MGQPDPRADHAPVAHMRLSAEDAGAGIDRDVIADIGMALHALLRLAAFIEFKLLHAEHHVAEQRASLSDRCRFADDHTPVVYKQAAADLRAGVDIDIRVAVHNFRNSARQQLCAQFI